MHIYPLPAFASDSDWPRRSLAATIDYLGNFDAGGLSSVEIVADASYTFRGLGVKGFKLCCPCCPRYLDARLSRTISRIPPVEENGQFVGREDFMNV